MHTRLIFSITIYPAVPTTMFKLSGCAFSCLVINGNPRLPISLIYLASGVCKTILLQVSLSWLPIAPAVNRGMTLALHSRCRSWKPFPSFTNTHIYSQFTEVFGPALTYTSCRRHNSRPVPERTFWCFKCQLRFTLALASYHWSNCCLKPRQWNCLYCSSNLQTGIGDKSVAAFSIVTFEIRPCRIQGKIKSIHGVLNDINSPL